MVMAPGAARNARYSYSKPIGEESCLHSLEPHVFWDKVNGGYRVMLRCRCVKHRLLGKIVHISYVQAEAASKMMADRATSNKLPKEDHNFDRDSPEAIIL